MIIEIFFIYIMVVLVAVIIKAIGKVGSGNPPCKSFEDLKEQVRKNREETRELKAKIKAAGLDTLSQEKRNSVFLPLHIKCYFWSKI